MKLYECIRHRKEGMKLISGDKTEIYMVGPNWFYIFSLRR